MKIEKVNEKNNKSKTAILLVIVVVLIIVPIIVTKDREFKGADKKAEEAVLEIKPSHKRNIKPIWEPPSGEIETLIFALQASAGTGIICYIIGYWRGRVANENNGRVRTKIKTPKL